MPLEIGYTAPYNEDAVVTGNWVVDAGLSINQFKQVTESGNTLIPLGSARTDRPADIILRPSVYVPGRANLAIFNWERKAAVEVDLGTMLTPGQNFSVMSVLDFFGKPIVAGRFDGQPVSIPVPREPRTCDGEFCAFVIMAHGDSAENASK